MSSLPLISVSYVVYSRPHPVLLGLVDLVVGVCRHGGGGNRFTLAGQRFVGRLTEHVTQVGDRGGDFRDRRCGDGTEGEPGGGGRRLVAFEPVEKNGEDGQRDADRRGVARIVVVADRQSEVIECRHGVAVLGLTSGQICSPGLTRWRGCRSLERSPDPGGWR